MARWIAALFLGLVTTSALRADDGPWWRRCRDCPRGDYSPLHYWAPGWYELRAQIHRVNLDQYPPGPEPSVAPSYEYQRYPCPATPPAPSSPYANPAAYYGRTTTP